MKQPVFLKLFKGCYGKQRNGETVGPLEYDELGMIPYKMSLSWYPSGRFSPEREGLVDIIEIIPAPEKLPEPFEAWVNVYIPPLDGVVMHSTKRIALGERKCGGLTYHCTVTPIERMK